MKNDIQGYAKCGFKLFENIFSLCIWMNLPYFFGYKTEGLPSKTIPKNLDPSCKTDLNIWVCFKQGKICVIAKLHTTDLFICSHSRERKTPSCSRINMVI